MKLYIPPQIESIGLTILTDLPFLGYIRNWLQVIIKADQTAEYLHNILVGGGITGNGGVERMRVDAVQVKCPPFRNSNFFFLGFLAAAGQR